MELTEIKVIEEEEGRSRGTVFLSFEENENWRQFVKGRFWEAEQKNVAVVVMKK